MKRLALIAILAITPVMNAAGAPHVILCDYNFFSDDEYTIILNLDCDTIDPYLAWDTNCQDLTSVQNSTVPVSDQCILVKDSQTGATIWSSMGTGEIQIAAGLQVQQAVEISRASTGQPLWGFLVDVNAASNGLNLQTNGDNGIGQAYCTANPNSTGNTGLVQASGSAIAAHNNLTLEASGLPAGQFGFFIAGNTAGFTPNPGGSNGNLCLAGVIGRLVASGQISQSGPNGNLSLQVDLTNLPMGSSYVSASAGETYFFQLWHRDNFGGGSNFTNGLEVVFQ